MKKFYGCTPPFGIPKANFTQNISNQSDSYSNFNTQNQNTTNVENNTQSFNFDQSQTQNDINYSPAIDNSENKLDLNTGNQTQENLSQNYEQAFYLSRKAKKYLTFSQSHEQAIKDILKKH